MVKRTLLFSMLLLAVTLAAAQNQPLPKPQVESAEGKPAPDFSLHDQDGEAVRLSSFQGRRVVLVFYRGYW